MENTKKKVYVIINPVSGTTDKTSLPMKIAKALDARRFEVRICITGYAGHGTEIANAAVADNADYVIAVGGDGTVNEVARALIGTSTALGILPLGSGNGLGRDLNISTNVAKALKIIAEENVITIDYGKVNDRIFFCTCGVGFDAVVANKAIGQKTRGTFMYFKNMLEVFFSQEPEEYEVECEEGTFKEKAFLVTCANASQYGYNAHIAPNADMQDGKMDITILAPLTFGDVPKLGIQMFTSTLDENKKMVGLVTKRAIIRRSKAGVMHIDGDALQADKEITVEIVPQGLKVLVPSVAPKKHPLDPLEMLNTIFGSKKH